MENLLAIFNKIQQVSPLPFFTPETLVVQNAGMQHWLNMSIAKERQISMNIDYALPAQFLWKLLKSLASEKKAPDQSPYSREVLTWRIYDLLSHQIVINDTDFEPVNHYWTRESAQDQADFKRYQLSQKLADLYEQYLIFRPDWIDAWCKGDFSLVDVNANILSDSETNKKSAIWQGKLWQLLHQQMAYNPVELMADAIANIEHQQALLPKRLSLFAINAMAPMWLTFLERIGQYTQVHFFHLNPCFDYWGDVVTEKLSIKRLNQWTELAHVKHDPDHSNAHIADDVGNPLLANLGQQGREFISLLQTVSTIDIDAYEQVVPDSTTTYQGQSAVSLSVLQHVQQDILSLSDKRNQPVALIDDSIIVSSSHSALREVQALHDWLLHQFNEDSALTPKDVLVMCPQIEDYAPYVNAVFARGWQDIDEGIPPLPCSIADRSSKDSDPIVAAYMELLSLPDSRFQVTHIYALLKLPAVQEQLHICADEVTQIATWLDHAAVHWGLNGQHKGHNISHGENTADLGKQYTWQQGLSRLIQGFTFSDQPIIVDGQLLLPDVEGQSGVLLGKLMLFIEQLQHYLVKLSQPRTATQWQVLLNEMLLETFSLNNEFSLNIINKAITALGEYTLEAHFNDTIALTIVRDFLTSHFSEPDTSRQFMVGQVTFCSMLPMRSIPFKVIAILGLNDGQFPRQRQPLAFDLMATTAAQLGDRSRRGDDRYLFLEAIISARKALYLSYQGKSIKTNGEKQPSIVLNELFSYLSAGYGWNLTAEKGSQLRQMPMQPFSGKNYLSKQQEHHSSGLIVDTNKFPSFDRKWLMLVDQPSSIGLDDASSKDKSPEDDSPQDESVVNTPNNLLHSQNQILLETLHTQELIRFYQHPSKWYAQAKLSLYFEDFDVRLTDDEPFVPDNLAAYQLREQFIHAYVNNTQTNNDTDLEQVIQSAILGGQYADTPMTLPVIEQWQQDSEHFAEQIHQWVTAPINETPITLNITQSSTQPLALSTNLPISGDSVVCYRSSTPKFKDFFILYLHQLMLQLSHVNGEHTDIKHVRGFYFNTKSQKVVRYEVKPIEAPEQKLVQLIQQFITGQTTPLLLNGVLANTILTAKSFQQNDLAAYWQGDRNNPGFANDAYIRYFWPHLPELDEITPQLTDLFQPMFDAMEKVK